MGAAFNNEPNEMIQRLIAAPFGYETIRRKRARTRLSALKGKTALIQYSVFLTTSRSARMRGARMYVGDGVRERVWV
jgi:hypothetical protein